VYPKIPGKCFPLYEDCEEEGGVCYDFMWSTSGVKCETEDYCFCVAGDVEGEDIGVIH